MEFGEYIIYVDESGDHSLTSIDPNFPVFCLAFCIFKKQDYIDRAVPLMQAFKFRWFGHDTVVMHESDITKKRKAFHFLQYDDKRERFLQDLSEVMDAMPMHVCAATIHKEKLKKRYANPENPYQLALLFCMERAHEVLRKAGAEDKACHIVVESRSPKAAGTGKEDAALELEFRRIMAGDHYLQQMTGGDPMPCFEMVFASKLANSTGLQIADLIARPIALRTLNPYQMNRSFQVIARKLKGWKVFP
ncbi:DUF3800 domain-containing protein [Mesorhizobium sp. RP14(2022)]|uniref:DUF3800 domain-containing protein n=1 Tax=Mesorhizobium liriopis TaxID=2953882 RepID=A0ABT1C7T0_9HYPH|nr:DUF3800 domain-containing protein [Mesorhizobium liriopis]MCO6050879.1 DUF3800 domain-containing protein [Mesorhizobium liriopis]